MSDTAKTYALMAVLAGRLNSTKGEFLCLIAKREDDSVDVYLDNVPVSGPKLNKVVDDLKGALNKLQETIKAYEDKIRYNG